MQLRIYAFLDSRWAGVLEGFVVGTGIGIGVLGASSMPLWWEALPAFVLSFIGWCCGWFALAVLSGKALLSIEKRHYPSYNPKKHKLRD